jgi:uncharacterized membrane protein (DUF106 family)
MDLFNSAFDGILKAWTAAFSWAPPLVGLAVLSAIVGVGMLWVFGKTSNQTRMKQVKRKVYASLFELRVFADEPSVTWRAQKSLFAANLRYMGLALMPALWLALPMVLLFVHLESFYGRAPLSPGADGIVTMAMAPGWDAQAAPPVLAAPSGVEVAGPVRVAAAREISWRIVPQGEVSGKLIFRLNGQEIEKSIEAGRRARYVPGKSVRSLAATLWEPSEPRLAGDAVEWIEIAYPGAEVEGFGLRLHWLWWFLIFSILAALLLKKRFGVVI